MKKKLIIGIPTINRADLLNESLIKYFEDFINTEIVIVDNGNQDIITREKKFFIYRPVENLGVAGSWNMLMDYAEKVKATHVLILNDDIYLGKKEEDLYNLINLFQSYHFINSQMNWCSFIISTELFKTVGKFDESFFPAYFEDNDYCYRMRLKNFERLNTPFLNPYIYRNSQTILKDPSLNSRFIENRKYFIEKWGGEPSQEKYKTPFNL